MHVPNLVCSDSTTAEFVGGVLRKGQHSKKIKLELPQSERETRRHFRLMSSDDVLLLRFWEPVTNACPTTAEFVGGVVRKGPTGRRDRAKLQGSRKMPLVRYHTLEWKHGTSKY